jgi:hypothetical protein
MNALTLSQAPSAPVSAEEAAGDPIPAGPPEGGAAPPIGGGARAPGPGLCSPRALDSLDSTPAEGAW